MFKEVFKELFIIKILNRYLTTGKLYSGKEPACLCGRHRVAGVILDRGDPLEEGTAALSGILSWRTPWTGARWDTVHTVAESAGLKRLSTTAHSSAHSKL